MAKNIRKAVLLLAMLSVIVGMFTACSNKKSDDGRTTFTVGFDAEFPPYGYKDDSGEYVGFDLDLAQEVCERNGWNLVKQPIDWDSKDMELSSGSIDCIWNGFTLNGREREYTWSKAYIDNSQVVIVKSGSGIKSKSCFKNVSKGILSSILSSIIILHSLFSIYLIETTICFIQRKTFLTI